MSLPLILCKVKPYFSCPDNTASSLTRCSSADAMQGTIRIRYLDWVAPQPNVLIAGAGCGAEAAEGAAGDGSMPGSSPAERLAAASAPAVEPGMPPAVSPSERFETIIASDVLYEVWPPPQKKLTFKSLFKSCGVLVKP